MSERMNSAAGGAQPEGLKTRRAALRGMLTAGGAILTASGVSITSALASAPVPENHLNPDADLISIGKRSSELHLERKAAAAARTSALDRFKEMAPTYQPKHRRAKPSPYHAFDIEPEGRFTGRGRKLQPTPARLSR